MRGSLSLRRRPTRRSSPLAALALIALVGLALTAVDWSHPGVSWEHIRTALGESLIVAAALGLTVDLFYKRELARDAFEASLGYLLPDELKAELRWIYGQQIVCVEHSQHVTLSWVDPPEAEGASRVRLEYELWRTMRNVSNEHVEHPTFASVHEWFRGEPSAIDLIECEHRGRRYTGAEPVEPGAGSPAPSRLDAASPGDERRLPHRIVLAPGEEAVFRYRGHELHHETGAFHDTFGAPTCRPSVIVDAPDDLVTAVIFQNRGRDATTVMGNRSTLPTVLLPFQPCTVRWWPVQAEAAWRRPAA